MTDDQAAELKRLRQIVGMLEAAKKKLGPALGMVPPRSRQPLARAYDLTKGVQDELAMLARELESSPQKL